MRNVLYTTYTTLQTKNAFNGRTTREGSQYIWAVAHSQNIGNCPTDFQIAYSQHLKSCDNFRSICQSNPMAGGLFEIGWDAIKEGALIGIRFGGKGDVGRGDKMASEIKGQAVNTGKWGLIHGMAVRRKARDGSPDTNGI